MIKVGIAGFGKMGQIRAREIYKRKDVQLIAIFEQQNVSEDCVDPSVVHCDSFTELLTHNLDAIFICAFNNVAAEYTIQALQAGLHVFCEKPPAKNCAELADVIAAEKVSGKILKYGFNHRFHYSVMQAKKLIETNELGQLLWVRGVYGKAGSIDYRDNWRNFRKYSGGGILMDQGIHMLDLFHYLTDKTFDVVSSLLSNTYWDVDVEDNAIVTLKAENVIATMHSSATQWRHKFLLEMCFEHGYINLDGILSDSRSYAPETLITGKREFEDVTFAMGKPIEQTIWFENDDSWKLELDDFVTAIKGSGQVKQGNSKDAYQVLSLIENIYQKSGFYERFNDA
jgi:predicted dehydrogenase